MKVKFVVESPSQSQAKGST